MSVHVSVQTWGKTADGKFKNAYPGKFAHTEIYFFFSISLMIYVDLFKHRETSGKICTDWLVGPPIGIEVKLGRLLSSLQISVMLTFL